MAAEVCGSQGVEARQPYRLALPRLGRACVQTAADEVVNRRSEDGKGKGVCVCVCVCVCV